MMQRLPKWLKERTQPYEGQLVLVLNKCVYPMKWQRGRIIKTFIGRDGLVRSVMVNLPKPGGSGLTEVERSINDIYPIFHKEFGFVWKTVRFSKGPICQESRGSGAG